MKNTLIILLVASLGFNVYFAIQGGAKSSQTSTLERSNFGIFQREANTWVFYLVKDDGSKEATGLRVPVEQNSNTPEWPEEIYASLSPDGKKVAYMQKPAWPHQISIANVDGTQTKGLVNWDTNFTPTHSSIENQFIWSSDSSTLSYAITYADSFCAPGGTFSTTLFQKDLSTGKEKTILSLDHKCDEWKLGAIAVPVD